MREGLRSPTVGKSAQTLLPSLPRERVQLTIKHMYLNGTAHGVESGSNVGPEIH